MDLIMGSFAEQYVPGFEEGELLQYESLLMENDPDVYNWYIGVSPVPANILTPVIEIFLKHQLVSRS